MRSIGIDLQPHVDAGLLVFHSVRPTSTGLEMHLLTMHDIIARYDPKAIVIDPISNFISVGSPAEVKSIIIRFIDLLKSKGITSVFTDLTTDAVNTESTNVGISSLMDTWILLRTFEQNGERNRGLFVLKSRGMPHSNQVREFVLSGNGIALLDAYLETDGVIMGSARVSREARDQIEALRKQEDLKSAQRDFERKKAAIEGQMSTLRAKILEEEAQFRCLVERSLKEDKAARDSSNRIAASRSAGPW
jgi:circadian clock protein KaiC